MFSEILQGVMKKRIFIEMYYFFSTYPTSIVGPVGAVGYTLGVQNFSAWTYSGIIYDKKGVS